jgi:hypothetical protein
MRAAFGRREHDGFLLDPSGIQAPPPFWIGGRTARSLRRAVELGDGWVPFGLAMDEVEAMLHAAGETDAWQRRATPIEVVLWPEPPVDPGANPDGFRSQLARARDAGATIVNLRFLSHSAQHHLEQMDAAVAAATI